MYHNLKIPKTQTVIVLLWLAFCFLSAPILADDSADLILFNGKIVTVDDANPVAQAVAISGDRIVAVGSDQEIAATAANNATRIDLDGKLVIPGFIEGHAHFSGIGKAAMRLKLSKASDWNEIVAMVAEAVKTAKPGGWILGRGWHQDKWKTVPEPNVDGLPFHHALSEISPDNPVFLTHASGHSSIANAKAMEIGGVTSETADPEGGEIVRDSQGQPIGVFRETAEDLIYDHYDLYLEKRTPAEKEADWRLETRLAAEECLSKGITSFHDAGTSYERIDFYKKLATENALGVRLWVMIYEETDSLPERIDEFPYFDSVNNALTVRAIKTYVDGALGSHGGWLLEPYQDIPSSVGLNVTPPDELMEIAQIALDNGLQLCTHAIGDRGNREMLDIYENAFKSRPELSGLRWRIEHAQHLHPDDVPRFNQLGVIASMQAVHCTSDGPWVPSRLGETRARMTSYVWRDLIKSGAVVSNGTDAPVEDVAPLAGIYAAVTRRTSNGEQFYPEQCMTIEESLRGYTINAAYSGFEEETKGSITVGKLADLTVLSSDITTILVEEIPETQVEYTIVGGKVLFQR